MVLKHHIRQKKPGKLNRQSELAKALIYGKEKYDILEDILFESLSDEMRIDICHKVKVKCKENVVGALYADLGGLFYSFSKKGEWIQINLL